VNAERSPTGIAADGSQSAPEHALGENRRPGPGPTAKRKAGRDRSSASVRLDQIYTKQAVAVRLYSVVGKHLDLGGCQLVEPSAGAGVFSELMPRSRWAYDIAPKGMGIRQANFLKLEIKSDREIVVIGNPPFGRNANMAVSFFNHAATFATAIAFVLPRSVRKASIINRLHRRFSLIHEEIVEPDAFTLDGRTRDVPTVFQIWVRCPEPFEREQVPVQTSHPDFEFVKSTDADAKLMKGVDADFVLQRVGANAGRTHGDFSKSRSSHYFIKGPVEAIFAELEAPFREAASNASGNPSLARSEIVALYRKHVESRAGAKPPRAAEGVEYERASNVWKCPARETREASARPPERGNPDAKGKPA